LGEIVGFGVARVGQRRKEFISQLELGNKRTEENALKTD
jgi:hypothetical protein